jgi:hypothetical protein
LNREVENNLADFPFFQFKGFPLNESQTKYALLPFVLCFGARKGNPANLLDVLRDLRGHSRKKACEIIALTIYTKTKVRLNTFNFFLI